MVILQSHRTQNLILRCYPNVSAILRKHIYLVSYAFFYNPYLFPPFNSQNFVVLWVTLYQVGPSSLMCALYCGHVEVAMMFFYWSKGQRYVNYTV